MKRVVPLSGCLAALLVAAPPTVRAQDTGHPTGYWRSLALGFASSILLHEAGHITASYAVGAHPYFGLNEGRPTIYSGIDANLEPRKQFEFSSAGLTAQAVADEGILDLRHSGSAFERGVLAGGIGTALFYVTLGRNGNVSDVAYMARTSNLSKDQVTLLVGGVAVMHMVRVSIDRHYADFFLHPAPDGRGGLRVGAWIQ